MSGPRDDAPGRRDRADAPRLAALEVLTQVRVGEAYANLVLPGVLAKRGLRGRDAAFTTELVSGTLRRRGTYDAVLESCVDRPLRKVQVKVLDCLRLGAHQLLSMRVPSHAAISTTVDVVRAKVGPGAGGFANAVLRRVSERDLDAWITAVAPDREADPFGHAEVAHSHPRWVAESLDRALAADGRVGEVEALLAADNEPPRVTLAALPGLCAVDELDGEPTGRSPYAAVIPGGDPSAIPAVAEGRAIVQDEGSQLVALALADAQVDGDDRRWLDLCAGPGGKAALLAAIAAQRGARLLANEAQPHRAELVRSATRAVDDGLEAVVVGDGTRPAWPAASFDRALVDAPCSGLGALRRRPEARWRRRPSDLDDLVPLQRSLLSSALDSVRPGGVVVYATCTPVLAETREVVSAVTEGRDDVRVESTEQLWPHADGTDAMFWAVLRRG